MDELTPDSNQQPAATASVGQWLDGWVRSLGPYAPATRTAYVNDVASFGVLLLKARGRTVTSTITESSTLGGQHSTSCITQLHRLAEECSIRATPMVRCGVVLDALTLDDLDPDTVVAALGVLRETSGIARAPRVVSSFGSLLRYLVSIGVLDTSPLVAPASHLTKVSRHRPTSLSPSELEALYAACREFNYGGFRPWPARDLAIMMFLVGTGVREDEFLRLQMSELVEDDAGARVVVRQVGPPRTVRVPLDTLEAVQDYLDEREALFGPLLDEDILFVRTNGQPYDARSLYRMTSRLFERAEIRPRPGSMVHLLRMTFMQHCEDAGLGEVQLQELLGHETILSTRRLLRAAID